MVGLNKQELGRFLNWLLKYYSTAEKDGLYFWVDSLGEEESIEDIIERYKSQRELSYEERVQWFLREYYETGMEYEGMLESLKDKDLDNFEWYGEIVKFPKYESELWKNTGTDS